ncbi:methylthioribose-1-phosphate isomerase [Acrasis kona]|uniref:Methylthioribose-1-phosphate isomerase n=1 Tax=Acrasis kona TaxID=1008807 RepID=A0AAW2Z0E8_9EUKA
MSTATLEAIKYVRGDLKILDQLLIPVLTSEDAFKAIAEMKVRGAPAIAIVAALCLAVEANEMLKKGENASAEEIAKLFSEKLDYLSLSRPTAVNLFIMVDDFKKKIKAALENTNCNGSFILQLIIDEAENLMNEDIEENHKISHFGADHILDLYSGDKELRVLTHCNTGALATMKYGTALGVIRALHGHNVLTHAYCTETRPYNQGARLTAFELVYEKIPATLIVDSAVSYLMSTKKIHCVVVGADRVCNNGDTANKVGTYQIAIAAKFHNIPFFVAAPSKSIDLNTSDGSKIKIEQRHENEITMNSHSNKRIVVDGVGVWNPGFDVTPATLITGIITELGVISTKNENNEFDVQHFLTSNKN